jgi:hypothetical protein
VPGRSKKKEKMGRAAAFLTVTTLILALYTGSVLAAVLSVSDAPAAPEGASSTVQQGKASKGASALKGGVLATFEASGERFRVWVTNPQTIWDLHQLHQGQSTATIPNGRIFRGPGRAGHNVPYRWHLDPQDITMADFTVEVCDASPSYVEENVGEFVKNVKRYCPWNAKLVELRNYTGREIKPPPPAPDRLR